MNIDFALLLVLLTFFSGIVTFLDKVYFEKKRQKTNGKMPWLVEQCRSLFPVFFFVLLLRSFLIEPYRVPSGSLKPSILDGDFIIVNKFDYGLRLPVTNTKILSLGAPHRGDIMVFHWPVDPAHYDFIKRVIGLPGDRIQYVNKTLYINGEKIPLKFVGTSTDNNGDPKNNWPVNIYQENLLGVQHEIYQIDSQKPYDLKNIIVPPHMYFMMGDNRDDSVDSRYWGFVPERYIVGKAIRIALSYNSETHRFRWARTFKKIN